jgi:hypothetical protein
MNDNKKYIIITCGVTGSGKSGLITETLKLLGLANEKYYKFLIDDLAEKDDRYKNNINQIINNICIECNRMDCNEKRTLSDCEKKIYNNPNEEILRQFEESYKLARFEKFFDNKNLNEINDEKLIEQLGVVEDTNIIILETTGKSIPMWLLENIQFNITGYTIVFSYIFVNLDNLVKRNKSRAIFSIENYINNKDLPAPRLPDVSKEILKKNKFLVKKSFDEILKKCITKKIDCGNNEIRLLAFNNDGDTMKLIYDNVKIKSPKTTRKSRKLKSIRSNTISVRRLSRPRTI